jgi:hypothetical protein
MTEVGAGKAAFGSVKSGIWIFHDCDVLCMSDVSLVTVDITNILDGESVTKALAPSGTGCMVLVAPRHDIAKLETVFVDTSHDILPLVIVPGVSAVVGMCPHRDGLLVDGPSGHLFGPRDFRQREG